MKRKERKKASLLRLYSDSVWLMAKSHAEIAAKINDMKAIPVVVSSDMLISAKSSDMRTVMPEEYSYHPGIKCIVRNGIIPFYDAFQYGTPALERLI